MKSEKLYEAMENIDDVFIIKAVERRSNSKITWIRWAASAACIVLIFAAGIFAISKYFPEVFGDPASSGQIPVKFVNGVQTVALKNCSVQETGVKGLEEILREYVDMPEKLNIAYFSAEVSKQGMIENFQLSLYTFNSSNVYQGRYTFQYDYATKQMTFHSPDPNETMPLPILYNDNYDVSYFSQQLIRIPLTQQIEQLTFDRYVLQFQPNTQLTKDSPVIDGSKIGNIPVLTLEEYKNGAGGRSDGKTALIFTLYDGVSMVSANRIDYRLTPANTATLGTIKNNVMKCDYYINNNKMKVTRDYGETWIEVGISQADMKETMEFYRSSHSIPENSYYISENPGGIIAVIYGAKPKLCISRDDGKTWNTVEIDVQNNSDTFEYGLPMVNRVIGFTSDKEGYAALGSSWSMGTGESKFAYFTHDGGLTWNRKELPLGGTNRTLTGMCFADAKNGVLTLNGTSDAIVPLIYYTTDGGANWIQSQLPEDQIPREVEMITKVDSLTYENGVYTLICGRGNDDSKKVKFQSDKPSGKWSFVESYTAVVHTVG